MATFRSPRVAAGALFAVLTLAAAHDGVAQVYVSGYTNGLFCTAGVGCVNPNTSAIQTTSILGTGATNNGQRLYYSNSTFSGTVPNGGNLAFNDPAKQFFFTTQTLSSQNVNNFGAFYLGGGTVTYSSPFSLWINFVDPTTNTLVFGGTVTGTVTKGTGFVSIDFDPNQQGFTFQSNGNWATITVSVADPNVPAEAGTSVTGVISAHVTPEPVTLSLIGTGLLGLAGAARRRRRKNS